MNFPSDRMRPVDGSMPRGGGSIGVFLNLASDRMRSVVGSMPHVGGSIVVFLILASARMRPVVGSMPYGGGSIGGISHFSQCSTTGVTNATSPSVI